MASTSVLCVAVEKTLRGHVGVRFAEASAERLSHAWNAKPPQAIKLFGAYATNAVWSGTLAALKQKLKKTDTLYVYLSVPLIRTESGDVLAFWDATEEMVEHTTLPIQEILSAFSRLKCVHTFVFLDMPHVTVEVPGNVTVFQACVEGEEPIPIPDSQCSAWARVLALAFSGRLPMRGNGAITVDRFHTAVTEELRRVLRKEADAGAEQTPTYTSSDPMTVVMDSLLTPADRLSSGAFSRVLFRQTTHQKIKDLPGFRKGFRLPERADAAADRFVAKMADASLQDDINAKVLSIRESFGLARKDLALVTERDGGASVRTPLFVYRVRAGVHPKDLALAMITREVAHIKDKTVILGPAWAECFGGFLDELILEFEDLVPLEAMIESLEATRIKGLKIQELPGGEAFTVKLAGFAGTITVTRNDISIKGTSGGTNGLLDVLMKLLNDTPQTLALE